MDKTGNRYRTIEDVAREELGEYPEKKNICIQEIREWILDEPKLNFCTDDYFIVRFLRSSKYNLDNTKRRIMNYYTVRKINPEWWRNRDCESEEMKILFNLRLQANLGQHPENGSHIFAIRFKDLDPRSINDYLKMTTMAFDTEMNSSVEVYGISIIIDYTGITLRFLAYVTYDFIASVVKYTEDTLPMRIKAIHLLNYSRIVHPFLQVVKFLLSKKLKQRLFLHNDLNSLRQKIPISCLPSIYGGTKDFKSLAGQLCNRIKNHQEYFKTDEKFGFLE